MLFKKLVEERLLCRAAEAADLDAAAVAQRAAEEAVAALFVDQAEAAARDLWTECKEAAS